MKGRTNEITTTSSVAKNGSQNDVPASPEFYFPHRKKSDSSTKSGAASPFVCSILGSYSDDEHLRPHPYPTTIPPASRVLQRIIRTLPSAINPSPSSRAFTDGEVEVCLEEYEDSASWKVVLRDGMRCVAHQTFTLPTSTSTSNHVNNTSLSSSIIKEVLIDPIVCWAHFSTSNDGDTAVGHDEPRLNAITAQQSHKNSMSTAQSNDHDDDGCIAPGIVVPLPFDACAIYTNPLGGIFIQRAITVDDEEHHLHHNFPNATAHLSSSSSWNLLPPEPIRTTFHDNYHNSMEIDDGQNHNFFFGSKIKEHQQIQHPDTATNTYFGIPSLFTLRHHLDEIRPVAILTTAATNNSNNVLFSDAFEKVIYVEKQLIVTFHTHHKRHAVWTISKNLPQPPELPMHDIMKQQQTNGSGNIQHYCQQQLYPSVVIKSIWIESNTTAKQANQQRAKHVFLASDRLGEPNILCFLVEQQGLQKSHNTHFLRLFSLSSSRTTANDNFDEDDDELANIENIVGIAHIKDIPCMSAQPIQASNGQSVDILVLQAENNTDEKYPTTFKSTTNRLYLYRSDFRIVECVFPSSTLLMSLFDFSADDNTNNFQLFQQREVRMVDLKHSSSCRVNVIFQITTPPTAAEVIDKNNRNSLCCVRTSVSLVAMLSSITETSLKAIECLTTLSSSYPASHSHQTKCKLSEFQLMLRSDCIRAMQFFGIGALLEEVLDPSWKAFSMIIRGLLSPPFEQTDINYDEKLSLPYTQNGSADEKDDDDDDAWSFLLDSDFGRNYERVNSHIFQYRKNVFPDDQTENSFENTSRTDSYSQHFKDDFVLFNNVHSGITLSSQNIFDYSLHSHLIFDSLHLLYEDAKLVSASRGQTWTFQLGMLLSSIVGNMVVTGQKNKLMRNTVTRLAAKFLDHYRRDIGDDVLPTENIFTSGKRQMEKSLLKEVNHGILQTFTLFQNPPCIFSWLENLIQQEREDCSFPLLDNVCVTTRRIHRFYSIIFPSSSRGSQSEKDGKLVLSMAKEGISDLSEFYNEIPPSVAIPIMEALRRCRDDPPFKNSKFYVSVCQLVGRKDLAVMEMIKHGFMKHPKQSTPASRFRSSAAARLASDSDDIIPDASDDSIELYSSMLFPFDDRIKEAKRLLRSSSPYFLRVKRPVEISDHDFERHKQAKLLLLCRRGLAAPLGRGMLTFATVQPILAESLYIPELSLEGRMPPNNATLNLDTSACAPDMMVWPEFHNGVAAGLRVDFSSCENLFSGIKQEGREQEIRTWIVYNKPTLSGLESPSNRSIPNNSASALAAANHSHGGFLMALGLRGYLSALAVTDIYEYLTQGIVTTTVGVLIGMAANKRGSCDAAVSKMLCLHIPSLLPPSFSTMEVASAAQTAAVSGIGLLYQGSSHRMMTEFLLSEIGRRPTSDSSTHDREGFTLSCGLALGMVNLCKGREDMSGLADLRIVERLMKYVVGGRDSDEFQRRRDVSERATAGFGHSDQEKTSRIFEGDSININVTAPGATLAIGLIFMRSGDKSIASRLSLPDTNYLLDYVRPDYLLLRVVARSLILWHEVEPTTEWVDDQVPSVLKSSYDNLQKTAVGLSSIPNDKNVDQFMEEDKIEGDLNMMIAFSDDTQVDRQAVRQSYAFIIAGGCFSLGLRYAGTGNKTASSTIMKYVRDFYRLRKENDPISAVLRPEKQILEICCACSALSLAMVMAGTGDMETFQLLRELRWLCDEEIRYGIFMTYAAAIGLLFLGGGSCTLGNEPSDIASLVLAFFPCFPTSTCDNQYHLQALRHVYALSVRQRSIETIDIDSNQPVFLPVELSYTDEEHHKNVLHLTTPCCVAPIQARKLELSLASNRYYPLRIELSQSGRILSPSVVYVKKKLGFLSYVQDPHALKSLVVQAEGSTSSGSVVDLIGSFTEDPRLLSFAEFLCDSTETSVSLHLDDFSIPPYEFCTEILVECLTLGETEVLPILLSLRNRIIEQERIAVQHIWDLRLLRSMVMRNASSNGVVRPEFVALLCDRVNRYFLKAGFSGDDAVSYFNDPWRKKPLLGSFLIWFDIPSPYG